MKKTCTNPQDIRKKLFQIHTSPWHKYDYENKMSKTYIKVKTVNITTAADVRLGVKNVLSLGRKLDCVFDHIRDNILDIIEITET